MKFYTPTFFCLPNFGEKLSLIFVVNMTDRLKFMEKNQYWSDLFDKEEKAMVKNYFENKKPHSELIHNLTFRSRMQKKFLAKMETLDISKPRKILLEKVSSTLESEEKFRMRRKDIMSHYDILPDIEEILSKKDEVMKPVPEDIRRFIYTDENMGR